MEALARPPEDTENHSVPILDWPSLQGPAVHSRAWAISIALHAALVAGLIVLPHDLLAPPGSRRGVQTPITLVAPPRDLTQRAPNRARVAHEFSLDNLLSQPAVRVPPAIPPMLRAPQPQPPPVRLPAPPVLPAPPKVADQLSPRQMQPPLGTAQGVAAPPPQILAEEKPKLAFEIPGGPSGTPKPAGLPKLTPPGGTSAMDAVRGLPRGTGGQIVGDLDISPSPGIGGGINQAPAPGRAATALEMMSDPMGVDFKPYLIRVLAVVKRNWLAVIPESARLGRTGRVLIQFAIDRDGHVPKLVIALTSGTDALDRAAVAGVSASNPFPPLPGNFKGSQVRLQLTFTYNLK